MTIFNMAWDANRLKNEAENIHAELDLTDDRAKAMMTQMWAVIHDVESFSETIDQIIKRGIVKDAHDLAFAIYKLVDMKYKREMQIHSAAIAAILGKSVGEAVKDIAKEQKGTEENPPEGGMN